MAPKQRVILVTGANSGLGYHCCLSLAKLEHTRLIMAGRDAQRVGGAVAAVRLEAAASSTVESGIVDLSSLKSVRRFADDLLARQVELSALVCNAGIQARKCVITEDGFESTVGTNHVGHFLLVKLLRQHTKRLVVVSSEVHDADDDGSPTMTLANIEEVARGRNTYNVFQAYSNSKLCNMIFAKEFVRHFPEGPEVLVYTPGFTPDTGLFRESKVLIAAIKYVIMFIAWCKGNRTNTPEAAGPVLARLASVDSIAANGWSSGDYIRLDKLHEASAHSRDPAIGAALWDLSEDWVKPFSK